jgi:uncharacterized membrane protein
MPEFDPKIAELEARLDRLIRTQIDFQKETNAIRRELEILRGVPEVMPTQQDAPRITNRLEEPRWVPPAFQRQTPLAATDSAETGTFPLSNFGDEVEEESVSMSGGVFSNYFSSYVETARADLEKFIGENLISLIGTIILVLGVGIGAKYAIDNGWISPLMRIIFGYAMGLGLLAVAIRLKAKYHNFSAVLLSGGMAIMYFVTYFAYAYYSLMPQSAAFVLMAIFTAFTVAAAILYNRQVIAHIGLVGAYAVPFLLSDGSGNYLFLFTYMAILNGGILAISVVKYWRPIFYTASGFTWLIFLGWFTTKYSATEHLYLALAFLGIFFATFYATKVIHGVIHRESRGEENIACIIGTAFIFYAFCFAISDMRAGVGDYAVFFTYLAIASAAILLTSFRFYGRLLIFVSYPFTWLIFGAWFASKYDVNEHFMLAAVFASIFFTIYYGVTLAYRLLTDEIGMIENAGMVLTNSFVYYGFGYAILGSRQNLQSFEGLFTGVHALFHSAVAQFVSRFRSSADDVVQVLAVLIITFTTISIPVQFDGNYVTLIWTVEAAVLFWFGRARLTRLFEYFSYPLMVLATGSLFLDWIRAFDERTIYISEFNRQPIANGDFVTAVVFVAAFAFIFRTNKVEQSEPVIGVDLVRPFGFLIAAVGLFVLYNAFRIEIGNYYHVQIAAGAGHLDDAIFVGSSERIDPDLSRFNALWQINYTVAFLTILGFIDLRKLRSGVLAAADIGFGLIALFVFLTLSMTLFYELRVSYMSAETSAVGSMNIAIRYISYLFAAGLLFLFYEYSKSILLGTQLSEKTATNGLDAVLHTVVFVVASCELINLMAQLHIPDGNKLGLSILWGVYALFLIVVGISKHKKHLRIAAFVLLAVTLVKLFLYDVADLPTIPKTILFVSLGLLMLLVSFLYNKYRNAIFGTAVKQEN